MDIHSEDAIILERDGKKYAFLPIGTFEENFEEVMKRYGLVDTLSTKVVYEIVDEKKFILAKIKYGI